MFGLITKKQLKQLWEVKEKTVEVKLASEINAKYAQEFQELQQKLSAEVDKYKEATEKVVIERNQLKAKVRKQMEADLLKTSMEIIVATLKIKEPEVGQYDGQLEQLRQRQAMQQSSLSGLYSQYNSSPMYPDFLQRGLFGNRIF